MTPQQKSWKERLKRLGITQSDFSRIVGLNKAWICQYLNCKKQPRVENFLKIEAALKQMEENAS